MLVHLHIRQLAVIEALDLDFSAGLTVVTGETGAGKSVLMHALALVTGVRADIGVIRVGADSTDVIAEFDTSDLPEVNAWLNEHAFGDADGQCLLRRVIAKSGRPKAFINGVPATVKQLGQIGEMLLNLHQQQAHQRLSERSVQLAALDAFGDHLALRQKVADLHGRIRELQRQMETLEVSGQGNADRIALLEYQLVELEAASLQPSELEELDNEHRSLANIQEHRSIVALALEDLQEGDQNLVASMQRHSRCLEEIGSTNADLAAARELLITGATHAEEAALALTRYFESFVEDPERLQEIEARLTQIYDLARKHKVQPDTLVELRDNLRQEKSHLEQAALTSEEAGEQLRACQSGYQKSALKLSSARTRAAKRLSQAVSDYMPELGMVGGSFQVEVTRVAQDQHSQSGMDLVTFLVAGGQSQTPAPLAKVVSGGEISRLSLAMQLVGADADSTPTLIFDEADTGIGGHTAEQVGRLLRRLGERAQVICVTHLPQIAVCGEHHLHLHKEATEEDVQVSFRQLLPDERKLEIARMLDGKNLTKKSLAHAGEMLTRAASL